MSEEWLRLIAVNGLMTHRALLVGWRSPFTERLYQRITNPRVGDLVLETTSRGSAEWPGAALGYLDRVVMEPIPSCDDCGTEDAYYVRPLSGGQMTRWTNATFIALPDTNDWHREGEAEAIAAVEADRHQPRTANTP